MQELGTDRGCLPPVQARVCDGEGSQTEQAAKEPCTAGLLPSLLEDGCELEH